MSEHNKEEKECLEKYYAGFSLTFFEKGNMPMPEPNEKYNFLLNSKNRHPYSFLTRYVINIEAVDDKYHFLYPETENCKESFKNLPLDYCCKDDQGKGSKYLVQTVNGVLYGVEVYDHYREFKQSMSKYRQLADDQLSCEFYRGKNSRNYINSVCEDIIQEYGQCKKQVLKSPSKYTPFYRMLLNQYRKIMLHLIDEYTPYLKPSIYNDLIYLTRTKEEVKSFKLKGKRIIQKINKLNVYFDGLKKDGFIDKETKISELYDLFSGTIMRDKINWIDDMVTLYTFIRLLIDENKIEFPPKQQWEIAAACFTLEGERLDKKDFPKQHETQKQDKVRNLKSFVSIL